MKVSIFYSWQSDLPSKTNRYFIEDAICRSLKEINKDNRMIACIDRDTKDELGSPDIRSSIFKKTYVTIGKSISYDEYINACEDKRDIGVYAFEVVEKQLIDLEASFEQSK